MEQPIWFSVPGAIGLAAGYLICPSSRATPPTVLVGAAPMLGFVIHQAYRALFEACGGWESKRRPVLTSIQLACKGFRVFGPDDGNWSEPLRIARTDSSQQEQWAAPLLFDAAFRPKPAYDPLAAALRAR